MKTRESEVTLLVVEDDSIDAMAIQRSFDRLRIGNPIVLAHDGLEALEALRGTGGRPRLPRPYMILLDLNMPRMDGFEFLAVLRADPELMDAVVFVLTTSRLDEDRARAYGHNIAGYIVKAEAGPGFLDAIQMLDHYWRIVELPG